MKKPTILAAMVVMVGLFANAAAISKQEPTDKTVWFEGKWGVFFHYLVTPAGTVNGGTTAAEEWNRQINEFDVEGLAAQLKEVGADYFVITVGQGAGLFLAPNDVYDAMLGNTSKRTERDLVADLADALNPLGIRLMVYTASELGWADLEMRDALGMTSHHNDHRLGLRNEDTPNDPKENRKGQIEYLKNWMKIHEQWSTQWGENVAGWWVDGCYHADIRFPENEPPNFKTMKEALLAGNPDAIVTFNGGKGVYVYSKYEDFTAGEISKNLPACPGPWVQKDGHRSRFHVLTFLGEWWGQGNPRYSDEEVTEFATNITTKGGFVTFDVPPQENGLIPEAFIPQLKQIGDAVSGSVKPADQ